MIKRIVIICFILSTSCHGQIWFRTDGEDVYIVAHQATTPPVNEPPPIIFTASGTGTITPQFDFSGTLSYSINGGDGVSMTSGVEGSISVTYNDTIAFTFSDYNSCTRIDLYQDSLTRDAATWTLPTGLQYLNLGSTQITGSAAGWSVPSGLVQFNIGNTYMSGNLTTFFANLPNTVTEFVIANTSCYIAYSAHSLPTSIVTFNISHTNSTGSYTSISFPNTLEVFNISYTDSTGSMAGWTLSTETKDLYVNNTGLGGDVASMTLPDELEDISVGNSECTYESTSGPFADINDCLTLINFDYCNLSQGDVNNIFADCVTSAQYSVSLQIRTSPSRTSPAEDKATLISRNWTVQDTVSTGTTYIGIPDPNFGVTETYRYYDDSDNWNGDLTYHLSSTGGYYTHYVDWTADGATDSDGNTGTEALPRRRVPTDLPKGSIVEIHDTLGSGYSRNAPYGNIS